MYLRPNKRKKNGSDYEYWSLVESVRTARGPRQRIVAAVGKLPGLDKEERIGWEEIKRIIDGKPISQQDVFEEYDDPPPERPSLFLYPHFLFNLHRVLLFFDKRPLSNL